MQIALSIILPIYGNKLAKVAQDSLDAILMQTFNFPIEIIVSNNGGDNEIKHIFNSEKYKDKITYIETDTILPMPQHFEWASRNSNGEYLMVLPARRILKNGAIQKYLTVMENNKDCTACCSHFQEYYEDSGGVSEMKRFASGKVSTKAVIEKFEKGAYYDFNEFWSSLPTSMNGIVRNSFVKEMRIKYNKPYFSTISPDVTSAFLHLYNSEYIYIIPESLFLTTSLKLSNGFLSVKSYNHYSKTLGKDAIYKYLPNFLEGNVYASVWEDYMRIKNIITQSGESVSNILKPNKYISKLIMQEESLKVVYNLSKKEARDRYKKVRMYMIENNIMPSNEIRQLLIQIKQLIKQKVPFFIKRYYKSRVKNNEKYKNVLEAAGF